MLKVLKKYKAAFIFIGILFAVFGIILASKYKKQVLQRKLIADRTASGITLMNKLPNVLSNNCPAFKDYSVSFAESEDTRSYTNSNDEPDFYYIWTDTLTVRCNATDAFDKMTNANKHKSMIQTCLVVKHEVPKILKANNPLYADYSKRSEILDVFDSGLFVNMDIRLIINSKSGVYAYTEYNECQSSTYKIGGNTVDPSPVSHTKTPTPTPTPSSKKKKNSYSTHSYGALTYDPDDYDDPDDFADDAWGDDFDDYDDAYDYWEDW